MYIGSMDSQLWVFTRMLPKIIKVKKRKLLDDPAQGDYNRWQAACWMGKRTPKNIALGLVTPKKS